MTIPSPPRRHQRPFEQRSFRCLAAVLAHHPMVRVCHVHVGGGVERPTAGRCTTAPMPSRVPRNSHEFRYGVLFRCDVLALLGDRTFHQQDEQDQHRRQHSA